MLNIVRKQINCEIGIICIFADLYMYKEANLFIVTVI